MGLAKSSESQEQTAPVVEHAVPEVPFVQDGVPLDIYSFFLSSAENMEPREKDHMRVVYEFAKSKCEEPTLGNVMHYLSTLEGRIGLLGYDKRVEKL